MFLLFVKAAPCYDDAKTIIANWNHFQVKLTNSKSADDYFCQSLKNKQ